MAARWAKKRDLVEPPIVAALRAIGATVLICDHPDLIVGYRGETFLLEVKDPSKRNHADRLKPSQVQLFAEWQGGPLHVVESVDEALGVLGVA